MMSNRQEHERERLRRLQENQLRARDPGPRVKVDWKNVKPKKQEPLLQAIWKTIPGRGKGLLFGFLFGLVASIVITNAISGMWPGPWGAICGAAFFLTALAVGTYVGKVTEDSDTGI